mmetsp:Transcript_30347/g.26893  ORF Transcript_30347/g.26893 Transcript_30347/m.26893 type:complete len:88 (-) Transcript_30347:245-508(-)
MEFSNLGEHCSYKYCRQLDYLPFQCDGCMHKFCTSHRRYNDHECTAPTDNGVVKKDVTPHKEIIRRQAKCVSCKKRLSSLTKTVCKG